jgi:hypothetical protein
MWTLLSCLLDCFRTRTVLQAEILALRHQLLVLQRSCRGHKLRLGWCDRVLWVWLSQLWNDWRSALLIVKPETVIAWHRKGFRLYWQWKSRRCYGRPSVSLEVRNLIQQMSLANPRWGDPRIHGGIAEGWNPGFSSNRRQIHGETEKATLPDVAHLSQKPRQGIGLCRFLRRPNSCVSTLFCLRDSRP